MQQDIRIADDFFSHPKTVRLHRRLGDQGVICLIRLWCYTSRYFPKGILVGMTNQGIADAVGWRGDADEFINSLFEAGEDAYDHTRDGNRAGFLELCETHSGTHYALHDWKVRNPYAYHREERSEMARIAADIRWEKKRNAIRKRALKAPNAERNAERIAKRNAPYPAPSPSPTPKEKEKAFDLPSSANCPPAANDGPDCRGHRPVTAGLEEDPGVRKLGAAIAEAKRRMEAFKARKPT
jgi:hypothetical protein